MIVEKKYWIETDQISNRILIHSWENKVYVTVEDARIILDNISGPASTWFEGVHWFDGTLTYTAYETEEKEDTDSGLKYRIRESSTKQLPNLGYTDRELDDEWMWVYGDRYIAIPVTPYERCSSPADFRYKLSLWVTKVSNRLSQLNASRGYSYKKLVSTLDIDYDPISNYDAMEHEFNSEQEGKHTVSREGNDSKEVTNNYIVPNAKFDISSEGITDVEISDDKDTTTTTVDGTTTVTPDTKVENYTTTYDNEEPRLNNDTRSSGTETTDDNTTTTVDSHSTPKFSRSETSGYRGYTDTYEAADPNKRGRIFNRTGNIGVTTTQQMLEQERNIARINVIQEYMEDINHHMLLAVY